MRSSIGIAGAVLCAILAIAVIANFCRPQYPTAEEWRGHTHALETIAWSPDGRYVASGGFDGTVRLWDAGSGSQITRLPGVSSSATCLAFSPDSRLLAAGAPDALLHAWEIPSGKQVSFPQTHQQYITGVAFSPDGKRMLTGGMDKIVILWNLSTRTPERSIRGFLHWVGAVTFSPDSRTFAVGDAASVRLYEMDSATPFVRIRTSPVHWLAYSPDGRMLAQGSSYGKSEVFNVDNITLRFPILVKGAASGTFRTDGRSLATGGGNDVFLWSAESGKRLSVISAKPRTPWPGWLQRAVPILKPPAPVIIRAIACSPDGSSIAAACADSVIRVWRNLPR